MNKNMSKFSSFRFANVLIDFRFWQKQSSICFFQMALCLIIDFWIQREILSRFPKPESKRF